MSKREAISRYNLIINRVRKSPCTLQDIKDYLELQSDLEDADYNISSRTFQRDINDIREIFKVDIQYNKSTRCYEIEDYGNEHYSGRMLEAFEIFHALNLSGDMGTYIHFDQRKTQGGDHLYLILHAIKNRFAIRFEYQKFEDDNESSRLAEPYALKEFKQRWYLLALEQDEDKVKLFALDRIKSVEVTKKKFNYPKDFKVTQYFEFCFGIMHHEGAVTEPIVLSFLPPQGNYIKSLPLHHSQEILIENEDELRIQLFVHPTVDFQMELLSFGEQVKVVHPLALKETLQHLHRQAAKRG